MRILMATVGFFWTLFAILGTFSLVSGGGPGPRMTALGQIGFLIFLWAPTLLIGYRLYALYKRDVRLQAEMLAAAGVNSKSRLVFVADDAGIAINTLARTFTLMEGGVHKTYPFSDFRAYRTYFEPSPHSRRGAPSISGLFVTVRADGEWHIPMLYQADQNRWSQIIDMEIIDDAEAA